jgi:hypothetical protein
LPPPLALVTVLCPEKSLSGYRNGVGQGC